MFWKKLRKLMIKLGIAGLGFFAVTFVVYFFNLDMKLTSVMEGFMLKRPAPVNAMIKPDAERRAFAFRDTASPILNYLYTFLFKLSVANEMYLIYGSSTS